jgi:hypothetical protein
LSLVLSLGLSISLVVEGLRGRGRYQRLKEHLAANEPDARLRLYRRTLRFELLTGALAVAVLGLAGVATGALPLIGLAVWLLVRRRRRATEELREATELLAAYPEPRAA